MWNEASIKIIAHIVKLYIELNGLWHRKISDSIANKRNKIEEEIFDEREFVKGIQNEYTFVEHIIRAICIHETKFEYQQIGTDTTIPK